MVGKWEQAKHIPDVELSGRYEKVMESKTRSTQKIPIAERLKEGAEQAAKDNAARPAPTKNTEKDR